MKKHPLFLLLFLLVIQVSLTAQVQWFQNQDGDNPYPNGTVATSVKSLTGASFIASYLWHVDNDQFTWKISKTNINGMEKKTLFITGSSVQVDVRVGQKNTIYLLKKEYPLGLDPQYTLIKLDSNLVVRAQHTLAFTGGYAVVNLNAFKLDDYDNIYLAGDGQYPDGPGFLPASFVIKADKNLATSWMKLDSVQTSYTDLQIDGSGYVWIVEDYYGFFPDVRISKRAGNGQLKWKKNITTETGRFSLSSMITEDDNLLLYGGKTISDNAQGIYIWKVAKANGNVIYKKTNFPANGIQLTDLKQDRSGSIFVLVSQYFNPGRMVTRVGRISCWNGSLQWSRQFSYDKDSCNLLKMVVNDNDRFYVVGEKKKNNILSKGFAVRIKKNGQLDGSFTSPDSVSYMRSHWLTDGIIDRNSQLISIGLTMDLDTVTYQSTYLRSFAIKLGQNNNNNHHHGNDCDDRSEASAASISGDPVEDDRRGPGLIPVAFPNPVSKELTVGNIADYEKLVIYNMAGKIIMQKNITGSNTMRIDVNELAGGVYFVQLQSAAAKKQTTLRFVVQK